MKHNYPIWTLLAVLAAGHSGVSLAGQLNLEQSPPGTATEPAPNIIVSVDDSGSMGAAGIATLKSALTQTFSTTNVPDGRIRLAWQSMNRCRGIPSSDTACNNNNGIKPLQGTHRTNFLSWVSGLTHGSGTPSHYMFSRAGDYLANETLGINSPWAADPGTTLNPVQSCRKAFQIFMTDGNWNSAAAFTNLHVDTAGYDNNRVVRGGGNADGTSKTLKDGTSYSITAPETRLYRDTWGNSGTGTQLSTLSDLAFHYWSTDLQPSLTDNVSFRQKRTTDETVGTSTVTPYWNPRNNPASWQHMVTYTIGFENAANWSGAPVWGGSTFAGDYAGLTSGTVDWPTPFCGNPVTTAGNAACDGSTGYSQRSDARKAELWHAALNSRGQFVPAPNAQALVDAFQGILTEILNDTSKALVSIASSTSRLRTDDFAFVAGFDSAENWMGELSAYALSASTQTLAKTPTWQATTYLDASGFNPASRKVLTHNGTAGVSFEWNNLSLAQKALLQGSDTTNANAQLRVPYLRGDRSEEAQNKTNGVMRNRTSRLGDIVNANIWNTGTPIPVSDVHIGHEAFRAEITGRRKMLYVGANDGMLHGFDAANGNEIFGYVPRGVYSKLRNYTTSTYEHDFFVDGQAFTGDADTKYPSTATSTKDNWATFLVGGLGGGGRGYYILDVTDPDTISTTTAASKVYVDRTFSSSGVDTFTGYADVGHLYASPSVDEVSGNRSEQIVKLNNGRWAVVMGNGYNSINERPALLIQYLDSTDKKLTVLLADSTMAQSNGLSAPRLLDINGDGTTDVVYAGDLRGNLWKFDLTSSTESQWGVSNWGSTSPCRPASSTPTSCTPLYVARDASGTRQPISVAPTWMLHPDGLGTQLAFGTGRVLTSADRADTSTQTLYSVLDRTTYTTTTSSVTPIATTTSTGNIPVASGRTVLVSQDVVSRVGTTDYYNTSENVIDYGQGDRGWYFDLPDSTERSLIHPEIFEGQKVLFVTTLPESGTTGESCDFTQGVSSNWVNVLNMFTGKPSEKPVWPAVDGSRDKATRTKFGTGEFLSLRKSGSTKLISLPKEENQPGCADGELCSTDLTLTGSIPPGARADWRNVR